MGSFGLAKSTERARRIAAGTVVLIGAWSASGCQITAKPPSVASEVEGLTPGTNLSALSFRVEEFYGAFRGEIVAAVDRFAGDASVEERRALTDWKARSTELALGTTLREDPISGLTDTWALCLQLRDDLETEETAARLGPAAPELRATIDELIEKIEGIAATVTENEDLEPLASIAAAIAAKHPIEGELETRKTGVDDYADLAAGERAVADSLGAMSRRVHVMTRLISTVVEELPVRAEWEFDLLASDALASATDSAERAVRIAEELPSIIERERAAVLSAVSDERAALVEALDAQRAAAFEHIADERDVVLAALQEERRLVLADIDRQRQEAIEAIVSERVVIVRAFGEERRATIREVADELSEAPQLARTLIDHAFVRAAQLVGALGLLALVGLVAWRFLAPHRARAND